MSTFNYYPLSILTVNHTSLLLLSPPQKKNKKNKKNSSTATQPLCRQFCIYLGQIHILFVNNNNPIRYPIRFLSCTDTVIPLMMITPSRHVVRYHNYICAIKCMTTNITQESVDWIANYGF